MGKYCSDCSNFDPKDKKAPGYCKCKKIKKYMFASQASCEKFSKTYGRRAYECEKLYDEALKTEKSQNDGKEVPGIIPIILLVTIIILKIFKVI